MDPLAPHRRRWLLAAAGLSLLGTLAFWAAMRQNDQALRPHSIVTLEIALDQKDAEELLRFWGPTGRAAARRSVVLDFGFILLGYAPFLVSLCLLLEDRLADRWRGAAKLFAVAAGAAGILDLVENVALLSVLAGPTALSTRIAGVSALGKFALVGAVAVFLVVVVLVGVLARITPLVGWFARAPGLVLIALAVLGILWRVALSSFGIPDLFWDERRWSQLLAGLGVGSLLAHLGVLGFLLDAQRRQGRGHAQWAARVAMTWPLALVPRLQEGAVLLAGYMVRTALPLVVVAVASVVKVPGGVPLLWLPLGGLFAWCVATALYVTLSSFARVHETAARSHRVAGTPFPSIVGLALLVLACQLAVFGALLSLYRSFGASIPVAVTVCVLLGAIASAYALVKLLFSTYAVVVMTLAALAYVSANAPGGHRLAGLDYYDRVPLVRQATEPPHDHDDRFLEAWAGRQSGPSPLVVVAVDGGGIRAATWATIVMAQLERDVPRFPYHVRMVTGASGGMVGLASYVASLQPPDSSERHRDLDGRALEAAELVRRVAADSLGDAARALVFTDFILPPFLHRTEDRGLALEQAWEKNTRVLGRPFAELAAGEADGWRPSLLVSPVLVEDGRRLLISNSDVSSLLKVPVEAPEEPPSRQAFSYYGHIEPWPGTLRLSTAVRLNASFPYVSPPAELPTDPPRHALDAGYYDEHGVELAGTWIWQQRKWLLEKTSGVLLVQVPDAQARERRASVEADRRGWWGAGLIGLTGPVETLRASQSAANDYRNDQLVRLLHDELNGARPGFFASVVFEPDAPSAASPPAGCEPSWLQRWGGQEAAFRDIALSWRLTGCEVSRLKEAIRGLEGTPSCRERRRLEGWWNAHRGASDATVSIACPPPPL